MSKSSNGSDLDALINEMQTAVAPFRETLRGIHEAVRPITDGRVADYIPELAKADPDWFAISVVTTGGQVFEVGDHGIRFSLQSLSKPFLYGLALEDVGREAVLARVGVEPSGDAFNSIVLDGASHRPFNPMVNAGAIAIADLVQGADYPDRVGRLLTMLGRYAGREVYVDNAVFMSERATGHRNRAIAHLMRSFGTVGERFEESLELYFQQCSVQVSSRDLATMGATLANGGVNPLTQVRAVGAHFVKDLLSVMLACGMYDFAGEWAYRVGLPAKSGVSGGIVAVVPGRLGIGIFSPRVDEKGNSVRGIRVCQELARRYGLHVFEAPEQGADLEQELSRVRGRAQRVGVSP